MKVQVLQGINLENPITTIKITLDATPITTLLDLVKSFHPVFMTGYSVGGNTVSIQSKLPHLWKEIAVALNKQATGEWSEQEAKNYMLDEVISNQVKSMSTIPILQAAHDLGYETHQMFISEGIYHDPKYGKSQWNRYYRIGVGQQSAITVSAASSGDAHVAQKSQRDKWVTNTLVDRLSLSIAPWQLVTSKEHLNEVFESYTMPVVIKPVGLTGGGGVTTNIFDLEHAQRAYDYAYKLLQTKGRSGWQAQIMIQQQVKGEDYRLLVIDGTLAVATKRIPAFVTGDGSSTIRQLIEETNKDPRRDLTNPAHTLKPIVFDQMLDEFLSEQSLTLDHIPAAEEKVQVRKVASMSQGGVTEDFTGRVHPQIKYLAESLAHSVHAFVLGVDIICQDIGKPLTIDNGSFIEMNTMPEAYLNSFPTMGQQHPEVGELIVKGLLEKKPATRMVVVLGHKLNEINDLLSRNNVDPSAETVGIYSEGSIYINGELMNSGLETWKAVESIKINALPSIIVLHYPNLDEVKEYGLGFDRIDLLVSDLWVDHFVQYEKEGLIKKLLMVQ